MAAGPVVEGVEEKPSQGLEVRAAGSVVEGIG